MSRRVIVYSNIGDNVKEIMSNATVWEGLQGDLITANIPFSGMRAVVGSTQVTLESSQAQLPEGDFDLFLMPMKVKSGIDDLDLIDSEDGESWDETDWTDDSEFPEDHIFLTIKDLMIARAKKAQHYMDTVFSYLGDTHEEIKKAGANLAKGISPLEQSLREQASKIQKNLGMFE